MTDVSISLDLKQQLTDFYEETKKTIDNHLLNLTNEMKKVKTQHELLYKKALEILLKTENEENSFKHIIVPSDYGSNFDSPLRMKAKTPLKNNKSTNLLKDYKIQGDLVLNLKKTKIEKKKNIKISKNKLQTGKTKNLNNTSFSYKSPSINHTALKINKNKNYQNKKVIKKNSLNSNNSANSSKSFKNYSSTNIDINSKIIKNKFKNENIKKPIIENNNKGVLNKNMNNKINNNISNDIRKFSIIDIPSINSIQEKAKKLNELNNNETKDNFDSEDESYNSGINDNDSDLKILNKIKSQKEKCFYLVSKSEIVPLKIRLFFSNRIRTVHNLNPSSQIISSYLELLDKKIKKYKNKDLIKFNPSLTAQYALCFIKKEDEYSFLNLNSINENLKKKASLLIKLILLIAGREYSNDIKFEFLLQELKKISNNQIRRFLINIETLKNIEQLSEKIIDSFISICESDKDIFNTENNDIPKIFEKIIFYLKEIYEFLKIKKANTDKKNSIEEERNYLQKKIVYYKIKN